MPRRKRRTYGTGSVTQRKDGRFQAAFFDEAGKRHYVYGATRQEALKKLQQKQRESEDGKLITGPKQKLGTFLYQWLDDVHRPNIELSSYVKYKTIIDTHIVPELGNIYINKLTPQHIQSFYTKKLTEKLSPHVVKSMNSILHMALGVALRWGLVSRNVTDLVKKPRAKKRDVKILTFEQVRSLFVAARGKRFQAFVALALTTGMRKGEILALRWSDIDLDEGVVTVRRSVGYLPRYGFIVKEPKTDAGKREIPLLSFVIELLKVCQQVQNEQRIDAGEKWQDLNLVVSNPNGFYWYPGTANRHFDKLLTEVGLDHMRVHDLRHGLITLLRKMHVDADVIKEIVGHEDITTTLGDYGHSDMDMKRDAVERLKDVFQQNEN